jgi:hypothetical protein
MKRSVVVFSTAVALCCLAPAVRAADQKAKAAADDVTITLDVAIDASSARASRQDWSITGPLRGDAVVWNGLVYAGGTLPDGDTSASFPFTDEGRVGTIVVRGQYIADGSEIASGAPHSTASTHIFMLDEGSGVITEGLEGTGTEMRAVVGGFGKYSGATGQVTEEVLGFNGSGGVNLRFIFTLTEAAFLCTISYGEDWPTRYLTSLSRRMPQKVVFADGMEKPVLPIPGEALYYFPAAELKQFLEYRKDNRDTHRMAKVFWQDIEEIIFLNPTEEEAKLISDNSQSLSLMCNSRFCEWRKANIRTRTIGTINAFIYAPRLNVGRLNGVHGEEYSFGELDVQRIGR